MAWTTKSPIWSGLSKKFSLDQLVLPAKDKTREITGYPEVVGLILALLNGWFLGVRNNSDVKFDCTGCCDFDINNHENTCLVT